MIRVTWAVQRRVRRPARLATATGMKLVEMAKIEIAGHVLRRRRRRVWMEDEGETRVNYNRLAQIQATGCTRGRRGVSLLHGDAGGCEGREGAEELVIRDVAEIVAEALIVPTA